MLRSQLDRIRNFGIVAHVDAGKTTLTERVLFYTGAIHRMGEVHEGSTVTDSLPQERQKGITITSATVGAEWRGHALALVDTPGHVDFTIEVERTLRVLDGAVVVLDAVAGVEAQTEAVWRQADRHDLPRVAFVNKLDRTGADFERCVRELDERLGARPLAVALPMGEEAGFVGVVDVVRMRSLTWPEGRDDGTRFDVGPVPAHLADAAARARMRLVEACADRDDAFAERFLETGDVGADALLAALRAATIARAVTPVLCGSAYRNRGLQLLLDAIVDLLPAPTDRPPARSVDGAIDCPADPAAPLAALAFKVVHEASGPRTFVRVYSGVLRKGDAVLHVRSGGRVRVPRLLRPTSGRLEDVAAAFAGEIVAVVGAPLRTGDTLADPRRPLVLEPIAVPRPMVRVALEPRTRADVDRMGIALERLIADDPSLALGTDPETGQTLLSGMGTLHLEIAVDRLRTDHRVEVAAGRPQVAYRQTLQRVVEHEVVHRKQTGGPGQFAKVVVRVGPAPSGAGLVFVDATRAGALPARFVAAVRRGVEQAMACGPLGGFPVVDVAVTVLDGATHPNDSSEIAFEVAGQRAFREAALAARPELLEPVVALEALVPAAFVGDVSGDLAARRGRVVAIDERGDLGRVVRARVPLAETFGYAGALRALTRGRGTHTVEPIGHEPVPAAVAKVVLRSQV